MAKETVRKRIWEWNNKEGRVLEGTYNGVFRGVGKFRSTVFHILEKSTNTVKTIWGNYAINKALSDLPPGSYVKITYKGIKTMKGTKGDNGKAKRQFDFDIVTRAKKAMGKLKSGGQKR
jgi:hypothetical protein